MIGILGDWRYIQDKRPALHHLLFLHGHHSSGHEMHDKIGASLRHALPHFKLHFPNGAVDIPGSGRTSWGDIQGAIVEAERAKTHVDPDVVLEALDAQTDLIREKLVNDLLRRENIVPRQLFIMGFSIGACMVTRLLQREPYAGLICLSGAFYAEPNPHSLGKTPILFGAGQHDGGLPYAREAHDWYSGANHPSRFSSFEGQGHEVGPVAIRKAVSFIRHCMRENPLALQSQASCHAVPSLRSLSFG
jgi:predicted esterase